MNRMLIPADHSRNRPVMITENPAISNFNLSSSFPDAVFARPAHPISAQPARFMPAHAWALVGRAVLTAVIERRPRAAHTDELPYLFPGFKGGTFRQRRPCDF